MKTLGQYVEAVSNVPGVKSAQLVDDPEGGSVYIEVHRDGDAAPLWLGSISEVLRFLAPPPRRYELPGGVFLFVERREDPKQQHGSLFIQIVQHEETIFLDTVYRTQLVPPSLPDWLSEETIRQINMCVLGEWSEFPVPGETRGPWELFQVLCAEVQGRGTR